MLLCPQHGTQTPLLPPGVNRGAGSLLVSIRGAQAFAQLLRIALVFAPAQCSMGAVGTRKDGLGFVQAWGQVSLL